MTTAVPIDNLQLAPEQAVNSILAVGIAAAEIADRPLTRSRFGRRLRLPLFPGLGRNPRAAPVGHRRNASDGGARGKAGRARPLRGLHRSLPRRPRALGRIDLVHASSSIQYVADPLAALKADRGVARRAFHACAPSVLGPRADRRRSDSPLGGQRLWPDAAAYRRPARSNIPITFTNFYDVVQVLNEYEIAIATDSPSSEYDFRGQKIPGKSMIFRAKEASEPRTTV